MSMYKDQTGKVSAGREEAEEQFDSEQLRSKNLAFAIILTLLQLGIATVDSTPAWESGWSC